MTLAKSLGGGYVPIGAVLYSNKVGEPIFDAEGGPNTGHTLALQHTIFFARRGWGV